MDETEDRARALERGYWHVMLVLTCLAWIAFAVSSAIAQDASDPDHANHPPEHLQLHEQFYQDWMRLDVAGGTFSCCNLKDCYPTVMLEARDGSWWALRYKAAMLLERRARQSDGGGTLLPPLSDLASWVKVPEQVIEHNSDRVDLGVQSPRLPRESPDGRSHACVSGNTVFCAVVGTLL